MIPVHMVEQPSIKILDKTLRILLLFGAERPEWGVTALASAAKMPKSTVYRVLRVLQLHGFLIQDPETRRFRLGLAALELGRRAYEGFELRRVAQPIMQEMAALSGETILLQVLSAERDRVVCIERVQARTGLRLILEIGATAPLHASCSSRALLASLPDAEIEAVIARGLPALTPHTITDPAQLRADLAAVRRNGYAVSFEELDEGVAGVSFPIRDYLDRVVASLTISGPLTRMNRENIDRYIDMARDGARRVAANLGHAASAGHASADRYAPEPVAAS